MTKKLLLLSLGSLIFFGVYLTPVAAQEATREAEGTGMDAEVLKELGKKVKEAAEKYQSQAGEVLSQIAQRKRGFIGQVERVTEESITLTNSKGTQVVAIDEEVTLLKANQEISIENVSIDDWLVVMGLVEEDDSFTPVRILVSSTTLRPEDHFVALGTIIDQSATQLTLLSRQSEELTLTLSLETEYQDHDGSLATGTEFVQDMQVLVVGTKNDEGKTVNVVRALVSLEALQNNE